MRRGSVGVTAALLAMGTSMAGAGACVAACTEDDAEVSARPVDDGPGTASTYDGTEGAAPTSAEQRRERERRLDREFPLHGVVTGVQLAVRDAPDPEGTVLGWLRIGSRVRVGRNAETTETCASGWHRVHPRGWACAGLGLEIGDTPPEVDWVVEPPGRDDPLPYAYHLIKENMVPEYHRLPSRDEQRAAQAYADRYFELHEQNGRRAARFLAGELPNEPSKPAVVHRYLERGFYVASTGVEVRAFRRFARTVRGSYVKEARTEQRAGSDHQGVELTEGRSLPVAFALRAVRPLIRQPREGEPDRFTGDEEAEVIPRQTAIESWVERERVGDHIYHRLEVNGEPRYARDWFIGVAEVIEPPFDAKDDEPWVHVDLGQQTLVLYEGVRPVFATLVSSGLDEHATPTGVFTIRRKQLSDTMSNLGPEAGDDRYRIEDVPWTQYFSGSIALHGAFWHNRFGLQRSHGCINLAPRDAHRVFQATWPRVPSGWHGITTDGTGLTASRVVVTE
jgi:hypothetical protein